MKSTQKFGIVGGLGALTGADILNQIVRLTPITSEDDHLDILFEQKPLIEPISVFDKKYTPLHRKFHAFDVLTRMEQNGCDKALLPCFITHTFLEELSTELGLQLISMTEAISDHIERHHSNRHRIGVLTSAYVREQKLFEKLLGSNYAVLYPDAKIENALLQAIYAPGGFKSGAPVATLKEPIRVAIDDLLAQGSEIILPGLTELSLIASELAMKCPVPLLNTNEIYAQFALNQSTAEIKKQIKVGIVGGVGPAATVDFMSKIIDATNAASDQDHIKMIVEHNPQIPDRTSNLTGDGTDPTLALYSTCKKLERGGADFIAIPCNTAHAYVDRIQRHLEIPLVNILTETTDYIRRMLPLVKKVGILATSGTIQSGLYQAALDAAGLEHITPTSATQVSVMEAIYGQKGVKAGFSEGLCSEQLELAILELVHLGAETIILGCTELPLISLPKDLLETLQLVDPTKILAQKCIRIAREYSSNQAAFSPKPASPAPMRF